MISITFLIFCILCNFVKNENILAIVPSPFYSHQTTFRPLWIELAKKNNVTLLTTDLMEKNENITQIDLSDTYDVVAKYNFGSVITKDINFFKKFQLFCDLADDVIRHQLNHTNLKFLRDDGGYKCDLIIVEVIHPWFYAFGEKFGCPIVGISSMNGLILNHYHVGNAINPSIYANPDLGYSDKLTFTERLKNTFWTFVQFYAFHKVSPIFDNYVEEFIGKNLTKINDLHKSLSLIIINANPVLFPVRPSTPITVNVDGLHLETSKPLPKDLQEYLDNSKNGVIYFSFGTLVSQTFLKEEHLEIFSKTFEELTSINVLWKFENETLIKRKSSNVLIKKWFPQQDVLRHPNVKLFITQGGLQSVEEALNSAVPMIGIPFYGDQRNNVKMMSIKKFGIDLDIKTIDYVKLKTSILEIFNNPLYKKNIEKLSKIFKDKPMNGVKKASWWIEYVLRHGGTEHLKSPSADIPLYQYFFIDIIAFLSAILMVLLMSIYGIFKVMMMVIRRVLGSSKKEKLQ